MEAEARFEAREEKASERKKPMSAGEDVACGEIQRRRSQPSEGSNPWSEAAAVLRDQRAGARNNRLRTGVGPEPG